MLLLASGELNVGMHGSVARFRGPFTPAQWMELEHQALIYKHMLANVPVPYNLIMPLLRSLYPYATSGSYASNSCKPFLFLYIYILKRDLIFHFLIDIYS